MSKICFLFFKKFKPVFCFFLKALYCCQLLGYCCKVNKAYFKGIFSRKANLLSFLMKKETSQSTISAKTFLRRTVCLLESQFQLSKNISIFKPIIRQFTIVLCLSEIAVHRRHVHALLLSR